MSYLLLQPAWCWGRDKKSMPTFGVFSISGESHETKSSDFCTLCTEGKALRQHLELITCVSQLTGGQQASRSGSCSPLRKTCTQWLTAAGDLRQLLLAQPGGDFWLTWEDRLPVWVPPQPSDVGACRWSVQRHTQSPGMGYSTNWLSLLWCLATIWQILTVSTSSQPSSLESQLGRQSSPSQEDVIEQLFELTEEMVGLAWCSLKSSGGLCWICESYTSVFPSSMRGDHLHSGTS